MCIAQFNLYLVVLVVAILPITRPAIASHNLARFNPWINPGIQNLRAPDPLKLSGGNVVDNWKRFKEQFANYEL